MSTEADKLMFVNFESNKMFRRPKYMVFYTNN